MWATNAGPELQIRNLASADNYFSRVTAGDAQDNGSSHKNISPSLARSKWGPRPNGLNSSPRVPNRRSQGSRDTFPLDAVRGESCNENEPIMVGVSLQVGRRGAARPIRLRATLKPSAADYRTSSGLGDCGRRVFRMYPKAVAPMKNAPPSKASWARRTPKTSAKTAAPNSSKARVSTAKS